jgi:hypothetical protein
MKPTEGRPLYDGMDVHDVEERKIGRVLRHDEALEYFEVASASSEPRYVPFSAIERIDSIGAHLNVPKDVVSSTYRRMPRATPDIEEGRLTGRGTAQSGGQGGRVPLDAEEIKLLRTRIHIGTHVFDYDDRKVGSVQAYDPETGYMRIEKGLLISRNIYLPVTAVSYLDDRGIHLWIAKAEVGRRFLTLPDVARDRLASG